MSTINIAHVANEPFSFQNFLKFISLGRILDTAVGNFMGLAFTALVASAVGDVFTPLLSGLVSKNIQTHYFVLKAGRKKEYDSLEEALLDNDAIIIRYGKLVHALVQFLVQSAAIYFLLKAIFIAQSTFKVVPRSE